MKHRVVVLTFLLFLALRVVNAQNPVADSLRHAIETGVAKDTNLVNALNRLSISYWYNDIDKAYELTSRALNEAKHLKFERGLAVAYNLMGVVFDIRSEYDSALYYYHKSVIYSYRTSYFKILASAYNNMGMVHKNRGNYNEAIRDYFDALRIFEKQADKKGIGNTYNNLGLVYTDLKQYQQALDFHEKSLKIRVQINDQYGIGASYTNLGLAWSNLGQNDKAREYYLKSLRIKEDIGDKYGLGILLNNLGLLYNDRHEFAKAIAMFNRAISYHREAEDQNGLIFTYINKSSAYSKMGLYANAEKMIDSARILAIDQKAVARIAKVYEAYAHLFSTTGDYRNAYRSYAVLDSLKDSLYSENMSKNIAEVSTRYETEKKEARIRLLVGENRIKNLEISQQKTRNRTQLLIATIVLILSLSALTLWYVRSKYSLKIETEHEKRLLQKQAYTAVVNAEESERKRIAMELHDGLGQLLSAAKLNVAVLEDAANELDKVAVDNAEQLIDQAISDLRNISHNLMPSALIRLGLIPALHDMASKINSGRQVQMLIETSGFDRRLPEEFEISLYRVIQEAVNNTLKHAGASQIKISLSKNDESLSLGITDNGKGIPENAEKQGSGIGWDDIRSRVSMFNGNMKLFSSPGQGTQININFSKVSV